MRAMDGDSVIAPEMMSKLVEAYRVQANGEGSAKQTVINQTPLSSLSPREMDVLRGITRGDSNKVIARDHGIAETTVKIHVQHVLRKLNVSSRVHAAVLATEIGLLD